MEINVFTTEQVASYLAEQNGGKPPSGCSVRNLNYKAKFGKYPSSILVGKNQNGINLWVFLKKDDLLQLL